LAQPEIGVVVPTLNNANTLDWTLCCLRSQRDVHVEIVAADSGSQDGTLDICKRWGVPTIYVPPGNMYRAINAGLRRIGAEWLAWLSSDDLVYTHSYARLIAHGESQRAAVVYGDCDFIDIEGRFLFALKSAQSNRLPGLLQHGEIGFVYAGAIWRRSAFEELGGFYEDYRMVSDYDFFSRMILSGYSAARLGGQSVAAFRRHSDELSRREAATMAEELRSLVRLGKVKKSPGSFCDLLCWYLQNSSNYLWRFMSGRAWPPKLFRELAAQSVHQAVR
jgi:glycosyltransferase involved in cell wall biosynthesis